jgi:DinB superfamily
MSRGRSQAACSLDWRARIAALVARARRLEPVAPNALMRPRHDGGWSAAQVLEHLVLGSQTYLAVMRPRVETAAAIREEGALAWRPRLGGRLLVYSMESPRRLRAPRILRPGPTARPDVVEAFIEEARELDSLLARAETIPWNGVRFASPINAWFRLNFGDGCLILITHAERHFDQIDRVLAEAGQAAPA